MKRSATWVVVILVLVAVGVGLVRPWWVPTPLRLRQAVVSQYLKEMPTCPAAGRDTYSESSWGEFGPAAYTIICGGHHHAGGGQGENYPQYTSSWGLISQ